MRKALDFNHVLELGGIQYHIQDLLGMGTNALVYKAFYYDTLNKGQKHHVIVKELFPYDERGAIYRGEQGELVVCPEQKWQWENNKESFVTGNGIHLKLLEDQPELMALGANINSYEHNGTLYSVLGFSGGRSLKEELNRASAQTLRQAVERMLGILDALEVFHSSGYLHLDVSPENIMLVGKEKQEKIFLIDYNSARPIKVSQTAGSWHISCKDGYSAPELVSRKRSALGCETDIFSVAAVFYRCIMGGTPRAAELRNLPAVFGEKPVLKDCPQPVLSLVREILLTGLCTLPWHRYSGVDQMRKAFRELLDRIDNVGVTHASLFENGKRIVDDLVDSNPALRYLNDEARMYPIRLEAGESLSLNAYLNGLCSGERKSGLVLGQGGIGKTTLLLHVAKILGRSYSREKPAAFYISLSGFKGADSQYIRRQLLLSLRFKPEENNYDSAMHALHGLLSAPLAPSGAPTAVLLLDGLNEIRDDTAPLVQEINELAAMPGVVVLVSSRSENEALQMENIGLRALDTEDVELALSGHGLLMPRNYDVLELLRTPLILYMYIQASDGGKQLDVGSREELMQAYMDALLKKELCVLPEESPERWQVACALKYVLPAIAAEMKKNGESLTRRQLLKVVDRCWRILRSRAVRNQIFEHSHFSEWIGHSKDIFAGTKSAEEWFRIIVDQILWQKLGMLSKEADSSFHIFHQSLSEYLDDSYYTIARQIRTRKCIRTAIIAVAAAVLIVLLYPHVGAYDDDDIRRVLAWSTDSYASYRNQYDALYELTSALCGLCEEDTDTGREYIERAFTAKATFGGNYGRVLTAVCNAAEGSAKEELYTKYVEKNILTDRASRVSWSGKDFEGELAVELLGYTSQRMRYYSEILPTLDYWEQSYNSQENYPDYPKLVLAVLEADAAVASELYRQVCAVHFSDRNEPWEKEGTAELFVQFEECHTSPKDDRQNLEQKRELLKTMEDSLVDQSHWVRMNRKFGT